jgi:hypothetical protein
MPLPRRVITKYLEEKNVKLACEVCGSTKGWVLPDEDSSKTVGLFSPRSDGGYVMPGGIIPAVILICSNCSNIRFFAERLISSDQGISEDG